MTRGITLFTSAWMNGAPGHVSLLASSDHYLVYRGGNATHKTWIQELGQLLLAGSMERFLARQEELLSRLLEQKELLELAEQLQEPELLIRLNSLKRTPGLADV